MFSLGKAGNENSGIDGREMSGQLNEKLGKLSHSGQDKLCQISVKLTFRFGNLSHSGHENLIQLKEITGQLKDR